MANLVFEIPDDLSVEQVGVFVDRFEQSYYDIYKQIKGADKND